MYYLNAFNDMLRKRRQQNNMMNGGGQDYPSRDYARPSGTDALGLGPAQDRNAFRDTLNSMSPMSRFAVGMMPVIGPAFNAGRLVDAGISAYQNSQLAPSRDARERAQDQFRASEITDMNAPSYSDDSMDRLSFNTPVSSPVAPQSSLSGQDLSPMAPVAFSSPVAPRSSFTSEALAPMAPVAFSSPVAPQSSLTGESLPSMAGDFGIRSGGAGGEFGGGVGTGNFGGSPADAADLGYAHGGMVDARHLKGRAPAPDDGYGALQGGEYVITKAAVEKYGKRLLDAINNGTFR